MQRLDRGETRRAAKIRRVVEECLRRRDAGDLLSDEQVLVDHPELLPELAQELALLSLMQQAGSIADDDSAAHLAPDRTPTSVTSLLHEYEIDHEVHRGGQGVVYRGIQKSTRRVVAIKVMREGLFAGPNDRARFEREVQILARLRHPNIVTVHDCGQSDAHFYFVMDFISGQSLDDYLAAHKPPIADRLRLFAKICDAVHVAHLHGVIHRDLKPGNIRVDEAATPHVLDFGLAKLADAPAGPPSSFITLTGPGQFVGSLPWASPEQVSGAGGVDLRTDVYSLGVILYGMLTQRFPYDVTGNMRDVVDRILTASPAPPSATGRELDGELDTIVLKCLHKEPQRRYQSAGDIARDVQRYLIGEPIEAKRDNTWYVTRKFLSRHRLGVAAAAALVLIVSGSAVALGILYSQQSVLLARVSDERDKAERVASFMDQVLSGVSPLVSQGRDTQLLKEVMDASAQRIKSGELAAAPEAELRLRLTIGSTLRQLTALAEADEMVGPALDLARAIHPGDHPDVAKAMTLVGYLRHDHGDSPGALTLWQAALDMRRRLYPGDHSDVVMTLNNVARGLDSLGRSAEAMETYQQALAMSERLPEMNPGEVALLRNNFAGCLLSQSRFADALPHQQAALATFQEAYPNDHPHVATAFNNLAECLRQSGRTAEALPYYEDALAMQQRLQPGDSAAATITLHNIAACLRDLGRLDEALIRHEQVVAIHSRLYRGDHPALARSLNALGLCLYNLGRGEEALAQYQQALDMRRRIYTGDHPDLAISIGNVGSALAALGRYDEAIPMHEEAVEMARRLFPGDHLNVAIALHNLADCLNSAGVPAAALPRFEESFSMCQRILPADHREVLIGKIRLGGVLSKLGRHAESEPLLVDAAAQLLAQPHATAKLLQMARDSIEALYQAWDAAEPNDGHAAKAAAWQARFDASARADAAP